MTQSSVSPPCQRSVLEFARRPKMLIAGGAVAFASATLLGVAMLLIRPEAVPGAAISAPVAAVGVLAPANALSSPASAMKDRWFEDSSPATVAVQTRDDWYADRAISAPRIARHVVDAWYLEKTAAAAPSSARHVADRWYLDVAVSPTPPLSTQSKDSWYLDT